MKSRTRWRLQDSEWKSERANEVWASSRPGASKSVRCRARPARNSAGKKAKFLVRLLAMGLQLLLFLLTLLAAEARQKRNNKMGRRDETKAQRLARALSRSSSLVSPKANRRKRRSNLNLRNFFELLVLRARRSSNFEMAE